MIKYFVQENEEFYACKWSVNVRTGAPLLLLAGKRGLLKALNCETEELSMVIDAPCSPIEQLVHSIVKLHPPCPSCIELSSVDLQC